MLNFGLSLDLVYVVQSLSRMMYAHGVDTFCNLENGCWVTILRAELLWRMSTRRTARVTGVSCTNCVTFY